MLRRDGKCFVDVVDFERNPVHADVVRPWCRYCRVPFYSIPKSNFAAWCPNFSLRKFPVFVSSAEA